MSWQDADGTPVEVGSKLTSIRLRGTGPHVEVVDTDEDKLTVRWLENGGVNFGDNEWYIKRKAFLVGYWRVSDSGSR